MPTCLLDCPWRGPDDKWLRHVRRSHISSKSLPLALRDLRNLRLFPVCVLCDKTLGGSVNSVRDHIKERHPRFGFRTVLGISKGE